MSVHDPENVFDGGKPSSLDPDLIKAEIEYSRYATTISKAWVGLATVIGTVEIAPKYLDAAYHTDWSGLVEHGSVGLFLAGGSILAISNIKAYSERLKQARYNQQINDSFGSYGLEP